MSPKKLEEEMSPEVPIKSFLENKPVKILTEKDAYLSEVMGNQPSTLAEIEMVKSADEKHGVHRLSLPEYFEPLSYDCTTNESCPYHGWVQEEVHYNVEETFKRWKQTKRGKFIFHWFLNKKRSVDEAKNLHGWYFVNRTLFPDANNILFSINGSIEEGDNILGFMPYEKALRKRNRPSELSQRKVNSESERLKDNPQFYEAKLDPEKSVDGGVIADEEGPRPLQETKDF